MIPKSYKLKIDNNRKIIRTAVESVFPQPKKTKDITTRPQKETRELEISSTSGSARGTVRTRVKMI